jgi:putative transcriptional regulator
VEFEWDETKSAACLAQRGFDFAHVLDVVRDAERLIEIVAQAAAHEAAAVKEAASCARRVRRRTGLTQAAFAARIGVPIDTVRNWEQGKRLPAGPAKALLRVLDRAPEAALAALR